MAISKATEELGWHHPCVRLALAHAAADEGICGNNMGLFTRSPVKAGEILLFFGGRVVDKAQFLSVQRTTPTKHFVQVAPELWMVPAAHGPETPDYINHSCDPNCGMLDSVTVAAMRDIRAGEELCIDYATVMDETLDSMGLDGLETFECQCGADLCRRRVTPHDYKIPELQVKYQGFFPPFMRAKLSGLRR